MRRQTCRSPLDQVSPEREVAWLVEGEPPAPAGEVECDVARTIEVGQRRCHCFPSAGWLMLRIIRKTAAVGSGPVSDGPVATASTPRPLNTKAATTPAVRGPVIRAVAPCLPWSVTMVVCAPATWTPRPWLTASEVVSIWSSSLLGSPSNGAVWTVNFTALSSTVAVAGYSPDNGALPARTPDVIPQPVSGTNVTSPWSSKTAPALTMSA